MTRPLVGLTVGPGGSDPRYLRLRQTYPAAIELAGGLPVLVPPMHDAEALHELLARLDAAIATAQSTGSRVDEINTGSSDKRYEI